MIETRNEVDDGTEKHLVRYQLHNHLGSAALELNDTAQVISYEEYHPYGTTSYQAKSAIIKSAAKRYRYTGMERDEETGLEYHSARYYLPWLGRWLTADPNGIADELNVYQYVSNNPVTKFDSNGLWETDMHFLGVYWAGRMQGAGHATALIAAIGSQSLDDSDKTSAPSLKLTGKEGSIQLANNSHSLNLTRTESEVVASRGIKEQNILLFGLGLHTVGDFLPHANLSGAMTGGHQLGYNEDFSTSHDVQTDADHTHQNPQKALATFERFREFWSKFRTQYDNYEPLKEGDDKLKGIADFIFEKDATRKEATASKELKAIGVTEDELKDVMKFYHSKNERIEAMKAMKDTIKGGEAIAISVGIWLTHKINKSFFNNKKVNLSTEIQGFAKITTKEFEARRKSNLAKVRTMYESSRYISGANIPPPIEEVYSPTLKRKP
jgi:RHS repeat-associated protein